MSRSVQVHKLTSSNIVVSGYQAWAMTLSHKNLRGERSHHEPVHFTDM